MVHQVDLEAPRLPFIPRDALQGNAPGDGIGRAWALATGRVPRLEVPQLLQPASHRADTHPPQPIEQVHSDLQFAMSSQMLGHG